MDTIIAQYLVLSALTLLKIYIDIYEGRNKNAMLAYLGEKSLSLITFLRDRIAVDLLWFQL